MRVRAKGGEVDRPDLLDLAQEVAPHPRVSRAVTLALEVEWLEMPGEPVGVDLLAAVDRLVRTLRQQLQHPHHGFGRNELALVLGVKLVQIAEQLDSAVLVVVLEGLDGLRESFGPVVAGFLGQTTQHRNASQRSQASGASSSPSSPRATRFCLSRARRSRSGSEARAFVRSNRSFLGFQLV